MKLTIITINYNNAAGLEKTMKSVLSQDYTDFEYIVVDGTTSPPTPLPEERVEDREVLESFVEAKQTTDNGFTSCSWKSLNGTITGGYYSEPDSGIYNAMNKGIRMAKGEYLQFLNSGDVLASNDVTECMISQMKIESVKTDVNIFYGNMLKPYKGKVIRDKGFEGKIPGMLDFYKGTLNHSPTYIKRTLFDNYGMYDETLKIVSDWKWFLQVIGLKNVIPVYTDIDVSVFDMTGISTVNSSLDETERHKVLEDLLPLSVLTDYEQYANYIDQFKRINRFWLTRKVFWMIERILFKYEKWSNRMNR